MNKIDRTLWKGKDGCLSYKAARKAIWKDGAAHAKGDSQRVLYADILAMSHCLRAETVYLWLCRYTSTESDLVRIARYKPGAGELVGAILWDVPIGTEIKKDTV